jgi:hypothetical protein
LKCCSDGKERSILPILQNGLRAIFEGRLFQRGSLPRSASALLSTPCHPIYQGPGKAARFTTDISQARRQGMTLDSDRRIAELKARMARDHEQQTSKDEEAKRQRDARAAAAAVRSQIWTQNVTPMIAAVARWLRENLAETGAKFDELNVAHEPSARTIRVTFPTAPTSTFVTFQLGSQSALVKIIRKTPVTQKDDDMTLPDVADITEEDIRNVMLKVLE